MTQARLTDYAVTLLRVSLGVMYLAHSVALKLLTFGLAGTAGYFESIGLPGWLAYATFAAEALGAIIWAHAGNGWVFNAPGGGWEYPLYLIVLSVAQFMLGDGLYALRPSKYFARS